MHEEGYCKEVERGGQDVSRAGRILVIHHTREKFINSLSGREEDPPPYHMEGEERGPQYRGDDETHIGRR